MSNESVVMLLRERGILLASHNQGKLAELRRAFADDGIEIHAAPEKGLPEPEETATTFLGNARLKASAAMEATGLPSLADDSGLAIDALDGAPGLYSARWAGPDRNYQVAFDRIVSELGGAEKAEGARAAFVCLLVLRLPDGSEMTAEGRVPGRLTFPPRGEGGFGYDPIFLPETEGRTFGEMTPEEKSRFSHRARALGTLRRTLGLT